MSQLLLESFDTYGTGNWTNKWTNQEGTIGAWGREGTNGLKTTGAFGLVRPVGNKQTLIAGLAFKIDTSKTWETVLFRDSGSIQVGVIIDPTNQIIIKRGTTTLMSTGYNISLNTWYYLEFRAKIAQSPNGEFEVRINGVDIGSMSGIDTQNSSNPFATNVLFSFWGFGSGGAWIDDIYIFDDESAFCNDFVGDVHVESSLPNGVGYIAQWAGFPVDAEENWEKVDEANPDGDTSFVATSGLGYMDSYEFAPLVSTSGSVYGVQVNVWGKKDDVGDRQVNALVRPTTVTYSGDVPLALGSTYGYQTFQFSSNPETSDYWTIAQVNASEFGIKQEV